MEWIKAIQSPERLSSTIRLPASKSISNRALIIRALCGYDFEIHNLSLADDTLLMQQVLNAGEDELYIRNAGTAMRFLTAYFACRPSEVVLRGSARMHERPIKPLTDALLKLGADIHFLEKEGYPPLHIQGKKLRGGKVEVDAGMSSQFVSALLLIAPVLENGLELHIQGEPASLPYIKLTLDTMKAFGIVYTWIDNIIHVLRQDYHPKHFFVEADWSSASYWYALAALMPGSELFLPHLFEHGSQGDSILWQWMEEFGVETSFSYQGCHIRSTGQRPEHFHKDMLQQPDLIPTFVSLCCRLRVPFTIEGTRTLQYKESDRAEVLKNELQKTGAILVKEENVLSCTHYDIFPQETISLHTFDDHRMAMSWMLQAAGHPHVHIENPDVTEKSYPRFWDDLETAGFRLERYLP